MHQNFIKVAVCVIIVDTQWNQTARLYEIQVTDIHNHAILVAVTSKCRVKKVVYNTWTETLANSADPDQTPKTRHLIGPVQFAYITINETVLSPRYGPFSQLTLRYNLPTSAVSALIMLNYQSYIKGSKDTISGEATLLNLLLIPFEKGSTRKGNNLLPVLSFLAGRLFQQIANRNKKLSFFQKWQKIYKCIKFPEISLVYFFQFCDGYYGIDWLPSNWYWINIKT